MVKGIYPHSFICSWVDPVTGDKCLKEFNERGNLQVSIERLILTSLYRFMSVPTPARSPTVAESVMRILRQSATEMITRDDTPKTSPMLVPCQAAAVVTTASISFSTMEIPVSTGTFQNLNFDHFWKNKKFKNSSIKSSDVIGLS